MSVLLLFCYTSCVASKQANRPNDTTLRTGTWLNPLGFDVVGEQDFRPVATRVFLDLWKHSTVLNDSKSIEQGQWPITETSLPFYAHSIPDDVRADIEGSFSAKFGGYPSKLPRFEMWSTERQSSVVATIGKGGAFIEAGVYFAQWKGKGTLSWEGDSAILSDKNVSAMLEGMTIDTADTSNCAFLILTPKEGLRVRIVKVGDEDNPIRDIQIYPYRYLKKLSTKTCTKSSCLRSLIDSGTLPTFHPHFIEMLKETKILRFAGWQNVLPWESYGDKAGAAIFADRTTIHSQTQAGPKGVAIEYMVELANILQADPWFSMPKAAVTGPDVIDPYARAFANLTLTRLDADRKVYVEYRSCCYGTLVPG